MPHRDAFISQATDYEMQLIDKIEACLERPITFRMDQPHLLVHNGYASAHVSIDGLKIVGDPERPPDRQALLHELLHGHRFFVERVPSLTGKITQRARSEYAAGLNNAIEHLWILPIQRDLGALDQSYWNAQVLSQLKKIPKDRGAIAARTAVALIILSLEAAPSPVVKQMAMNKFAKNGFLMDAHEIRNLVKVSLNSKRTLTIRLLEWLGLLQTESFALSTFVALGENFSFEPLNTSSVDGLAT